MKEKLKNGFLFVKRAAIKVIRTVIKKAGEFIGWIKENPKEGAVVLVAIGSITKWTTRFIQVRNRNRRMTEEEFKKQTQFWDPSERHYWRFKRPLTTDEWIFVKERHDNGHSYHTIFNHLGVLA